MDLVSGYKGVVGLVFGNDSSALSEDSYIERLLDRISNGSLAEDRRTAIVELQSVVVENHAAQLAFGAMGFPVIMGVLKEECEDIEMVRGALETLVGALTPIDHARGPKNDIQPALMNSDLLSREVENISLLLSLLSEDDFYVRYYTLQLLTALLTNSPDRLQEAILTIPRGITRLMDMLMDREVIRNEALLLLTYLTREAEEIQKIVVFEGAFEKLFSIIKEEGGPDGGVIVQDCLQLLNNLLRNNTSNQILLRETMGFDPLISILKLRGNAYKLTQQKTINLLSALETVSFLIMGTDPGKDIVTNKTVLVQRNVLDHLLMLGVESQWAPVAVRCAALRCIGDLISGHPKNCNVLLSKFLREEPQVEPALNSVLRIILRSSSMQEFIAADYVLKSFCEKNADGQTMLAFTLIPQPHASHDEDVSMSFGSMLLRGLTLNENDGDLEMCCRAASVLTHVLKDNIKCKERVLGIELEAPVGSLGGTEPLMHSIVKYLALASSMKNKDGKSNAADILYVEPIILKLLVTWLSDCPSAVHCFLDARPHLTFTLELISNPSTPERITGLAAVILGECILYNKSTENGRDTFAVVDAITQKIGLASYFKKFDGIGDVDGKESSDEKKDEDPILSSILDAPFVNLVKRLEAGIRENIVNVYSQPKSNEAVVPAELEQKSGECDADYIKRLKSFVERQCSEMQSLLSRNATLAEDMSRTGGGGGRLQPELRSGGGVSERIQAETLRKDLQEARQRIETLKAEKSRIESEALTHKTLAEKMESELQSLSGAYNSLEQANFALETEVKALRSKGPSPGSPDLEAIRAEAREEALKESEGELSDLLVCLGQEQSKVERLSVRLMELGEDVEDLLQGIGDEDDAALPQPQDSEEEEDE